MVTFGAIDFSAAVARLAGELGLRVTICDGHEPLIRSLRFSRVAEVVVDRPERHLAQRRLGPRDVVLAFTHDRKLRERGVDDDQLERIASSCGLDIGARTPAETAISMVGEVIARRTGRGGEPLGETAGPIHGREAALS